MPKCPNDGSGSHSAIFNLPLTWVKNPGETQQYRTCAIFPTFGNKVYAVSVTINVSVLKFSVHFLRLPKHTLQLLLQINRHNFYLILGLLVKSLEIFHTEK